jgi:hypothetical protein
MQIFDEMIDDGGNITNQCLTAKILIIATGRLSMPAEVNTVTAAEFLDLINGKGPGEGGESATMEKKCNGARRTGLVHSASEPRGFNCVNFLEPFGPRNIIWSMHADGGGWEGIGLKY